jgi:hypothetical protein
MAEKTLFKIGTTSLNDVMDIQNYELNAEPVTQTWTDGNMVEHRNTVRTRIVGSVQLIYTDASAYSSFLNVLSNATDVNGVTACTGYVQNTNQTVEFGAFVDVTAEAKWNFTDGREFHLLTLEIRGA